MSHHVNLPHSTFAGSLMENGRIPDPRVAGCGQGTNTVSAHAEVAKCYDAAVDANVRRRHLETLLGFSSEHQLSLLQHLAISYIFHAPDRNGTEDLRTARDLVQIMIDEAEREDQA